MLNMKNVSKVYRTDTVETHALREFSLTVEEGEFVSVTGPSGYCNPNPVPADAASIARGKEFYDVNCYVCHGTDGRGEGPVGLLFAEKAPVDLNDAYTQDQTDGQIFAFFVMTLAAAEAAVGLAIVIALFRLRESTDVDELNLLKW